MDQIIKTPEITVLMPVYNGQDYIREAIDSILSQTFRDFEFLIIDDGSTDKSAEIIRSYKDNRIKYVSNGANRGLPFSLNRGLEMAEGQYIARMDCDDISQPERLKKQLEFMKSHPDISVCGTWIKTIGKTAPFINKFFTDPDDIKASLLFNTSLAHPSVMIRRSDLERFNLRYNADYKYFEEDYALWVHVSKQSKLANIPEVLFFYRVHKKNVTGLNVSNRKAGISLIRQGQLEILGLQPSEEDMYIHNSLRPEKGEVIEEFIKKEEVWLDKIIDANKQTNIYAHNSLSKIIYSRFRTICGMNAKGGLKVWRKFVRSTIFKNYRQKSALDSLKIFIKCLLRML